LPFLLRSCALHGSAQRRKYKHPQCWKKKVCQVLQHGYQLFHPSCVKAVERRKLASCHKLHTDWHELNKKGGYCTLVIRPFGRRSNKDAAVYHNGYLIICHAEGFVMQKERCWSKPFTTQNAWTFGPFVTIVSRTKLCVKNEHSQIMGVKASRMCNVLFYGPYIVQGTSFIHLKYQSYECPRLAR